MSFNSQYQEEVLEEVIEKSIEERSLTVFNDDFNTFDFVIETLVDICNHSPEQAEQCTTLIHYKGKCSVKHGGLDDLRPMRDAICERGLSAKIV